MLSGVMDALGKLEKQSKVALGNSPESLCKFYHMYKEGIVSLWFIVIQVSIKISAI